VDNKNYHIGGLPICLLLYFAPASTGVYPPAKVLVGEVCHVLNLFVCTVVTGLKGNMGNYAGVEVLPLEVMWYIVDL
jgi:hypothetical protein